MPPLDANHAGRSNFVPLAILSAQALLVAVPTTYILQTIRRAARTLPPAAATRSQQSVRRRNVAIFSVLALVSLASVTTFGVAWRVLSYFEWAEKGNHETPGSLWTGWYGTGHEGIRGGRWRLGDWWTDVDLIEESEAKILAAPEAFLYLYQHFCGIAACAIFFGVEGRRRNFPWKTIISLVLVSTVGSLGFALNLFFIAMLYSPLAVHDDNSPRHDALFAPKASVLYLPVIGAIALQQYLPHLLARREDLTLFRIAYVAIPLFLAFAPKIVPVRWGQQHTSKASAHHSYVRAFYILGITSMLLFWKQFATTLLVNTPIKKISVYDLFMNAIGKHQHRESRFMTGLHNTAQNLKLVSGHPAISVTGNDVVITAVSLLVWCFVRQLDVVDVLENSFLSFLGPKKEEKHVAFKENGVETIPRTIRKEEDTPIVTSPRKRGRPKKNASVDLANSTSAAANAAAAAHLRRSTRRRTRLNSVESDGDEAYEPPAEIVSEVKQIESDGASGHTMEDMVGAGESTALALLSAFVGGLGQLAAGVLGAEVTGGV